MLKQHKTLQAKFDKCNEQLELIEDSFDAAICEKEGKKVKKRHATAAFVTFSSEAGYVRCRNIYPNLGFLYRLTYSRWQRMTDQGNAFTKFFGGTRLIIKPAPEPAEIIWENLDVTPLSRVFRLTFTSVITLAFLAASFILIYKGQVAQAEAEFQYPTVSAPSERSEIRGADGKG